MTRSAGPLKLKAQLFCGEEIAMGPRQGRTAEAIIQQGLDFRRWPRARHDYRRTWMLVDVMNRNWSSPRSKLVGGRQGGGAHGRSRACGGTPIRR